jgi:hypothetical protein
LDLLDAAGQFAAREHGSPPASKALQADICAKAGDFPVNTAAGVRLSHFNNIV